MIILIFFLRKYVFNLIRLITESFSRTRYIPESIRVIKEAKGPINKSISDFSLMIHAIHELTNDNQGSLKDNFDHIELYSNSLKDQEIETVQKHIDSIERNFDKL